MAQPTWWDAPAQGAPESQVRSHTARGKTYKVNIIKRETYIPWHKRTGYIISLLAVVVFIPILAISARNWPWFWVWFIFFGLPFISGMISGVKDWDCFKTPEEREEIQKWVDRMNNTPHTVWEANGCGQSDIVVTVEQSQPLEQLRGLL